MSTYEIVACGIVAVSLLWVLILRDTLAKKLTKDKIELIDYACEKGVGYAEQMFKNDKTIDRNKLAIDFAFEVVRQANVMPEYFLVVIKGIIEDKVRELPKTNK